MACPGGLTSGLLGKQNFNSQEMHTFGRQNKLMWNSLANLGNKSILQTPEKKDAGPKAQI